MPFVRYFIGACRHIITQKAALKSHLLIEKHYEHILNDFFVLTHFYFAIYFAQMQQAVHIEREARQRCNVCRTIRCKSYYRAYSFMRTPHKDKDSVNILTAKIQDASPFT